ncbi:MAG TPA: ROK family transcriptional regulator [Rhodoferax sp.]
MKTTGDQQLVKRINRSVLLRLLRIQPGQSRAQLAQKSGLTKSTVSLLVRELIDENWLTESDAVNATGAGRPFTPLQIDGRTRALVGVEVAVDVMRVACVSLVGKILWSTEEPLQGQQPIEVCQQIAGVVARAHELLLSWGLQLTGLGVGLPGAFDETTGKVNFAANLGWWDVDFLPLFTHALEKVNLPPMPVYVQNEADTAALSEYEFVEGHVSDSVIFVTCDVGVGAGIVLNDRLFTGQYGGAGEIGHGILQIDGPLCSCGRHGCAEAFFGSHALEKLVDPLTGGKYLGVVLANLWTTFDPSVLIVGGPSCARYPGLIAKAQETLTAYATSARMPAPPVRPARYGLLASAVGAAALVLHRQLRPLQAPTGYATNPVSVAPDPAP